MTLKRIQSENAEWTLANFGEQPWQQPLMGISEEVGELNHALLKQWQGIRGDFFTLEDEAKDAVGDIIVYLANLCNLRGWDLDKIANETWSTVSKRNWKINQETGSQLP